MDVTQNCWRSRLSGAARPPAPEGAPDAADAVPGGSARLGQLAPLQLDQIQPVSRSCEKISLLVMCGCAESTQLG